MNVFFYVIEHDFGFAPNPFHGVCSLGCCKPDIRKVAEVGDYVLGTGAVKPKLRGHLTYWMKIDEVLTFDEYWADRRFLRKKAVMHGTTHLRYGDNIYHRDDNGTYHQEDSFHSNDDGSVSLGDLKRDTGKTDKVLLGRTFAFWGRSGIPIPPDIACFLKTGPGHRYRFTEPQKQEIVAWIEGMPARGNVDEPAHWQFLEKKKRKPNKRQGRA